VLEYKEQKQAYFDDYWRTRDIESADVRSLQRAELIRSLMPLPDHNKVLDLGCGRGLLLSYLSKRGYTVTGCDIAGESITNLKNSGYDVFLCDIERDPIPGKYDIIICLEVLQQMFDPVAALEKMKQRLTPAGRLIVSLPNEFHIRARMQLLFGKSHLGHFDESHIRLFSPSRSRQLFKRARLKIEALIPVPVIPPRITYLDLPGKILAGLSPALFSLSQIYRLRP
jgi:2-polyprenyl-3-methyl-5-hydroxy-6-metoxy-1,4-benzoquinol methylase